MRVNSTAPPISDLTCLPVAGSQPGRPPFRSRCSPGSKPPKIVFQTGGFRYVRDVTFGSWTMTFGSGGYSEAVISLTDDGNNGLPHIPLGVSVKLTHGLVIAAVGAGLTVAAAIPAAADPDATLVAVTSTPELSGNYAYTSMGSARIIVEQGQRRSTPVEDARGQWTLAPCGVDCAHVTSSNGGWSADMHLIDGRWQLTRSTPADVVRCGGVSVPATLEYSLDAATLAGTVRTVAECGYAEQPISLAKI